MNPPRIGACLVSLVLSCGPLQALVQAPEVPLKDLKRHVGQEVVACGRAVMYECDDDTGELLLALEEATRGPELAIPRQYWPDTRGRSITDRYLLTYVCGRGVVAKRKDKFRVIVHAPDQLEGRGPAALPLPFAPAALHTCATGVAPPTLLREVKPSYTREAMRAIEQGKMYLEAEVREDGSVGEVRELSTLPHGLAAEAVAALKQWRFRPATLAGRAVPVVVTVEMTFKLK